MCQLLQLEQGDVTSPNILTSKLECCIVDDWTKWLDGQGLC